MNYYQIQQSIGNGQRFCDDNEPFATTYFLPVKIDSITIGAYIEVGLFGNQIGALNDADHVPDATKDLPDMAPMDEDEEIGEEIYDMLVEFLTEQIEEIKASDAVMKF